MLTDHIQPMIYEDHLFPEEETFSQKRTLYFAITRREELKIFLSEKTYTYFFFWLENHDLH